MAWRESRAPRSRKPAAGEAIISIPNGVGVTVGWSAIRGTLSGLNCGPGTIAVHPATAGIATLGPSVC